MHPQLCGFGFANCAAVSFTVFAISSACSLLSAKSCTPFVVVSERIRTSGWFSGQPVAKAVTKSAEVERWVIGFCPVVICLNLLRRHEGGDFNLDLGAR